MPDTRTARLAQWQVRLLVISGALLWLSGAAWLALHYFGKVQGEFGAETNPFEPWSLRLHGFALIPALMGFGGLLVAHIPKGWRHRDQRSAGAALTATTSILIFSGYLLYYVGSDALREWTSLVHWSLGLVIPGFFIWHYRGRVRRGRRRQSPG